MLFRSSGTIGPDDPQLFTVVDSAEDAWDVVRAFYNLPVVVPDS